MAGSDCHRNSVGLVPHVALLYPTLSGSLTLDCNGVLGYGFPVDFFPVIFVPQKILPEDANFPPKRRSVVDCGWLSGCGQGPGFFEDAVDACLYIWWFPDLTNLLSSHICTHCTSWVYIIKNTYVDNKTNPLDHSILKSSWMFCWGP